MTHDPRTAHTVTPFPSQVSVDHWLRSQQSSAHLGVVVEIGDDWLLTMRSLAARTQGHQSWLFQNIDPRLFPGTIDVLDQLESSQPELILWTVQPEQLDPVAICHAITNLRNREMSTLHIVAGRSLAPRDRLLFSQAGAIATVRHPEDMWHLRALLERA